jgi:hypothetical protein
MTHPDNHHTAEPADGAASTPDAVHPNCGLCRDDPRVSRRRRRWRVVQAALRFVLYQCISWAVHEWLGS